MLVEWRQDQNDWMWCYHEAKYLDRDQYSKEAMCSELVIIENIGITANLQTSIPK